MDVLPILVFKAALLTTSNSSIFDLGNIFPPEDSVIDSIIAILLFTFT